MEKIFTKWLNYKDVHRTEQANAATKMRYSRESKGRSCLIPGKTTLGSESSLKSHGWACTEQSHLLIFAGISYCGVTMRPKHCTKALLPSLPCRD